MDNTFNIQWLYEYINNPGNKTSYQTGTNYDKFRSALYKAEEDAIQCLSDFAEILIQIGEGFRQQDWQRLSGCSTVLKEKHGYEEDISRFRTFIIPGIRRAASLDVHSPEQVASRLSICSHPLFIDTMTVAMNGIPLKLWHNTVSIKDNLLRERNGLTHVLVGSESGELSRILANQETRFEFNDMYRDEEVATGERHRKIDSFVSYQKRKEGFPYSYFELTRIYLLNRFLTEGFENIEDLSKRFEITCDRCMFLPGDWLKDGRISQETFDKINRKM
jgi:hypothetical protein